MLANKIDIDVQLAVMTLQPLWLVYYQFWPHYFSKSNNFNAKGLALALATIKLSAVLFQIKRKYEHYTDERGRLRQGVFLG